MDLQHLTNVMGSTSLMAFAVLAFAMSGGHAAPRDPAISIVADSELGPGATHGLGKIAAALQSKGIVSERAAALDAVRGRSLLVVGLAAGPGAAARLLQASGIDVPTLPESLVIHHTEWNGKPALLVTGADDRGLMYAEPDVLEAAYAYDDAGNLTGIAYSNGIEASYTYDAAYRLDTVTWEETATQELVAQFDCDVNALGLRTAITEAVQQAGGGGVDTDLVEYEYDLLGRLTRETRTRGQDVLVDKSYQYDLFGNRTKVINHIGPSEQDATFNELHQLETDGNLSFFYDDSGNLYEKKQGDTVLSRYEYDFLNRLSKVTHNPGQGNEEWQTYQYDAEGGLTRTETDTGAVKRFVNDHHSVTGYHQALVELDGQSSVLAWMVYGLDLVKMSRSGEYYYIYDPLGSTRALTDSDADVTDTYLYDAYGNLIERAPDTGFTENPYLFTGERLDPGTGLYYLRARFYDPASGRFTQLDTFLGSPQDPLSLHRYVYANANPANLVDPSGHMTVAQVQVTMAMMFMATGITVAVILQSQQDATNMLGEALADLFARQSYAYSAIEIDLWGEVPPLLLDNKQHHVEAHAEGVGVDPDPGKWGGSGWWYRFVPYAAAANAVMREINTRLGTRMNQAYYYVQQKGTTVTLRLKPQEVDKAIKKYAPDMYAKGVKVWDQAQYVEIRFRVAAGENWEKGRTVWKSILTFFTEPEP